MGALDPVLGVLVLASWVNMVLYTIEIQQMVKYFTRYPKDSWVNKIAVIFCLLTESVTIFCSLALVYLYSVSHWGEPGYLATQPWAVPTSTISAAMTNVAVQVWLTRMVYSLTKQWIWPVLIGLLILPSLPCAFYTAHLLLGDLSYAANVGLDTWVTIWFTTSVATDVAITAVLVWKFSAFKTRFSSTRKYLCFDQPNIHLVDLWLCSLIRRLILSSVRNGSVTTILTIILLSFYKLYPTNNVWRQLIVGRFYTLSMLSNLNNRQDMLGSSSGTHSHSVSNKITGGEHPTTGTALRIRQDIETHYHTDAESIPMGDLEYGIKAREVQEDGTSDVDLSVMTVKHENGKAQAF
ncbi:hypothetical protein MVEN_01158700 [Mycena venus]|uniref:DUF6534 domain-containing protein n=1 Tax=Mycena venus TaxID=2733690 RepID=A0A8H6Y4T9_9AGAR|nr:hypothetical protein MVEN_01158700 [Mycena venus]